MKTISMPLHEYEQEIQSQKQKESKKGYTSGFNHAVSILTEEMKGIPVGEEYSFPENLNSKNMRELIKWIRIKQTEIFTGSPYEKK